ncbi:LytR C-terminal domain-containing protein [Arthrobacter halodurans]|uniref:LytR C-terminal domain-containing protein n=1 Tax=Arthrobacter halodurans TaxID=516699 RepID=A0ABV4UQZ3_9MICC
MVQGTKRSDPRDWHGHRIVTEDDLVRSFDDRDPAHADHRRRRNKRLRHGIVLVLLLGLVATAVVGAYLVMTRQLVIPAWEPKPEVAAAPDLEPACPRDVLAYVEPAGVTVNVYNATRIPGLAGAAANRLEKRGFKIGEIGNKTLNDPDIVAAVVSGPEGRAHAMSVQRHIKGTEFVKDPERGSATVDLVVGQKFGSFVETTKVVTKDGRLSCPRATAEEKAAGEAAGSSGAPAASRPAREAEGG